MGEAAQFEDLLLRSARSGDYKTIVEIIKAKEEGRVKININCKGQSKCNLGWTPLHLACYFGHLKCAESLLISGGLLDIQNDCGDTPLHKAALTNRDSLILLLLEHGANVNIINGEGKRPSHLAAKLQAKKMLQGAERADRKSHEEKFLHASREGDAEEVKRLLQSHDPPSINCTDRVGNTALHCAAYRGHADVAVVLLQNGCDPSLKNNAGQTCLHLVHSSALQQVLAVSPLRSFQRSATRFEGPLLRRMRIVGWRMVWSVLERGVLSFFKNRADASSGVARCDFRYLDNAIVASCSGPDPSLFTLQYSDRTKHKFAALHDPVNNAGVNKQKWLSALERHIKFSTHYVQHGFSVDSDGDDDDDGEKVLKPLGCMEDALSTAKAHQDLLDQQLAEVMEWVKVREKEEMKDGPILTVIKKIALLSSTGKSMASKLNHCLVLMKQQEEVRNLQLREEKEKVRVLEESLRVLAKEHNDLEESIADSLCGQNSNLSSDDSESVYGTPANSFVSAFSSSGKRGRMARNKEEFFDVYDDDDDDDARTLRSLSPCESECSTNTLVSCMSSLPLDPLSPDSDGFCTPINSPVDHEIFSVTMPCDVTIPSTNTGVSIESLLSNTSVNTLPNSSVTHVTPLDGTLTPIDALVTGTHVTTFDSTLSPSDTSVNNVTPLDSTLSPLDLLLQSLSDTNALSSQSGSTCENNVEEMLTKIGGNRVPSLDEATFTISSATGQSYPTKDNNGFPTGSTNSVLSTALIGNEPTSTESLRGTSCNSSSLSEAEFVHGDSNPPTPLLRTSHLSDADNISEDSVKSGLWEDNENKSTCHRIVSPYLTGYTQTTIKSGIPSTGRWGRKLLY